MVEFFDFSLKGNLIPKSSEIETSPAKDGLVLLYASNYVATQNIVQKPMILKPTKKTKNPILGWNTVWVTERLLELFFKTMLNMLTRWQQK